MLMLQSPMHSTQQHSGLQVDKLYAINIIVGKFLEKSLILFLYKENSLYLLAKLHFNWILDHFS